MRAPAVRVEIVNGVARLGRLEARLWDLFQRSRNASPFQSPAWLLPWAKYFADEGSLRAIIVLSDNRMVGMLPLVLCRESQLRFARLMGYGISDYLGALVDPAHEPEVLHAFSAALQGLYEEVDVVELTDVSGDSVLPRLPSPLWGQDCEPCGVCPKVRLPDSLQEYTATLPDWLCRNLRQGESRLVRQGDAAWKTSGAGDTLRILDALFELHTARWRARGECGVLMDDRVRAFHGQAAPQLVAHGLLELSALFVGGRPVAVTHVLQRRDAQLYLTGFDPKLRFNAGSLAIFRSIQRAIETRRVHYDFLRGREAYKYAWGAIDSLTVQLRSRNPYRAQADRSECRP